MEKVFIKSIKFNNYKALSSYKVNLQETNILVGPNNCGKSTIISAFRILDVALKKANIPNQLGNAIFPLSIFWP